MLRSVREQKIPHAQLFLGIPGSGNLPMTLAFAQYLHCENPGPEDSCGICASCRKSEQMIHPDIHYSYPFFSKGPQTRATDFIADWRSSVMANPYLDYNQWISALTDDNKQGNINAFECRDIIRKLSLRSYEGGFKTLILWLPEYLGKEGNILLKTLEEPPPKTLLLLVGASEEKILPTILSRTQSLRFPRLSEEELIQYLIGEKELHPTRAAQLSAQAEGDMNRLRVLLLQLADDHEELLRQWISACARHEKLNQAAWIDEMGGLGREAQKQFLAFGLHFVHECVLLQNLPQRASGLGETTLRMARWLLEKLDHERLERLERLLEQSAAEIERNANPRILFTALTIRFGQLLKNQIYSQGLV